MKLVIDIPDEDYQKINSKEKIITLSCNITDVIKTGIPLPKGHGRLVDVGKYEKEYFNVAIQYDDANHVHSVYTSTLPTIVEADRGVSYEQKTEEEIH